MSQKLSGGAQSSLATRYHTAVTTGTANATNATTTSHHHKPPPRQSTDAGSRPSAAPPGKSKRSEKDQQRYRNDDQRRDDDQQGQPDQPIQVERNHRDDSLVLNKHVRESSSPGLVLRGCQTDPGAAAAGTDERISTVGIARTTRPRTALSIGHGHASHPAHNRQPERSGSRGSTGARLPCALLPTRLPTATLAQSRCPFRSTAAAASAVGVRLLESRPIERVIRRADPFREVHGDPQGRKRCRPSLLT